jgi:hypothetical protein
MTQFSYRIGSKWGVSEWCFPATAGYVPRLKLLVEPHPATLRNNKDLYGMREAAAQILSFTATFTALSHLDPGDLKVALIRFHKFRPLFLSAPDAGRPGYDNTVTS